MLSVGVSVCAGGLKGHVFDFLVGIAGDWIAFCQRWLSLSGVGILISSIVEIGYLIWGIRYFLIFNKLKFIFSLNNTKMTNWKFNGSFLYKKSIQLTILSNLCYLSLVCNGPDYNLPFTTAPVFQYPQSSSDIASIVPKDFQRHRP